MSITTFEIGETVFNARVASAVADSLVFPVVDFGVKHIKTGVCVLVERGLQVCFDVWLLVFFQDEILARRGLSGAGAS